MIIGIDPHKMSHTANAVDPSTNTTAMSLRIDASLAGYRELMRWSKQFGERRWAVENARGLGRDLAQWLVARGEVVLDVPCSATARVRELSRGSRRKTDVIDAAAAASVAALHGDATVVTAEDHTTVFALLEERRERCCATGSGCQPIPCGVARSDCESVRCSHRVRLSVCSSITCLRNRANSSRSDSDNAAGSPARLSASRAARTQFHRVPSAMFNDRATSAIGRPDVLASSIASLRN
jgi:hypothetical protein